MWVNNNQINLDHKPAPSDFRSKLPTGRKRKFSELEQEEVSELCQCKLKQGVRKIARKFTRNHPNKPISPTTVWRYRKERRIKPFHQLSSPNITKQNKVERVRLGTHFTYLFQQDPQLINNIIFCDEFYVYIQRKPNSRNDIIWARCIEDIPDEIRYRKVAKNPICIGIFVAISMYGLMYIMKDTGQSWDGKYFRRCVIHHIRNWVDEDHVVQDPNKLIVIHDNGPGWFAYATQDLLVHHFGPNGFVPARNTNNNMHPKWPGNSPDMNPVENIGAVIKEEVDDRIFGSVDNDGDHRMITTLNMEDLERYIEEACDSVVDDSNVISKCVTSFVSRCAMVIRNHGNKLPY